MENGKLGKITKVIFYNDVRIDDERIDVLVIEADNKCIILDVNYGLSIDDLDITKNMIKNTASNYKVLYDYNEIDFQDNIDFKDIYKVILYKNGTLLNKLRGTKLEDSDYLEIIDMDGNNFFLNILNNHLYKRMNLYKVVKYRGKVIVFERYKCHRIKTWMFYNPIKKIVNIFNDLC